MIIFLRDNLHFQENTSNIALLENDEDSTDVRREAFFCPLFPISVVFTPLASIEAPIRQGYSPDFALRGKPC